MASGSAILDSDFRYTDRKGNLLRTRTELSIAEMLSFLDIKYEYNHKLTLKDGKSVVVDFKTEKGLIEVIDDEKDITKYKEIKREFPETKIIAIGHPKFAAQIKELEDIILYKTRDVQTGSIFIEDPSFAFDGPKGMFDLQVPKDTTYLLEGEATVEKLSTEIIKLLIPKMPECIEAVGVYIYEGYNKGAHILSHISKS